MNSTKSFGSSVFEQHYKQLNPGMSSGKPIIYFQDSCRIRDLGRHRSGSGNLVDDPTTSIEEMRECLSYRLPRVDLVVDRV